MGSFNVGCGISNLSINEGEKAGFVLLAPSVTHRSNRDVARRLQIYSTDFFEPFLPPVFGIYDDYGRLASVKSSVTTDVIESIFQKPAQSFINAVGPERGLYDSSNELTELYVSKDILSKIDVWGAPASATFFALGFEATEPGVGFSEAFIYEDFRIQNRISKASGELGGDSLWTVDRVSDGKVLIADRPGYSGLYPVLDDFARVTGVLPGYPKDSWSIVKLACKLSGMLILEDVFTGLSKHLEDDEWLLRSLNAKESALESIFDDAAEGNPLALMSPLRELSNFTNLAGYDSELISKLKPYVGAGEYSTMACLVNIMTSVNRSIQPSFSGEQMGNNEASLALNGITEDILKVRMKKRF